MNNQSFVPALLILEDGNAYFGEAVGQVGETFGELVFATAMTGYQETLTDPSYFGQIVIQTAPHIGNTGVNNEDDESKKIFVNGYVVHKMSRTPSSWRAQPSNLSPNKTLATRLVNEGVVSISGLDTRSLTKHLRDKGAMKAGIFSGADILTPSILDDLNANELVIGEKITPPANLLQKVQKSDDIRGAHYAEDVSTKERYQVVKGDYNMHIAALDLGIKAMTPEIFASKNVKVSVLPINSTIEDIENLGVDGVFFSNGPGDPASAHKEVELLRTVLTKKIPFFGICLGNQMLGRALGFDTYKLKFGHRGINQPVKDLKTGRVEITAHNHGFAIVIPVDEDVVAPFDSSFGKVRVSHINLNDDVVEGIECLNIPAFSVQYHPEAAAGPHDASYLFDRFIEMMQKYKESKSSNA